mgnify:CR=1 FL=1
MTDWINSLFTIHSSIQAVVILSLIITIGLGLGNVKIKGLSLGIAFVFFIGILAGHFGLAVDPTVVEYAETFGLALFVYTLGLHVGPNFFGSLKHEGVAFNMWSRHQSARYGGIALRCHHQYSSPWCSHRVADFVGLVEWQRGVGHCRDLSAWCGGRNLCDDAVAQVLR